MYGAVGSRARLAVRGSAAASERLLRHDLGGSRQENSANRVREGEGEGEA